MIILKTLKWSNCFSYGDNNTLDLEEGLIVQLVGTNGTGKSSIPLLIEEALFNKNSKGIKKVDIANRNRDEKGYSIHLTFEVDKKGYSVKVDRKSGLKVLLECDGEDISSHTATNTFKTIQHIIGLDFKTFSQLVYQSTTSSLQFLTATDTNRKKFLIELLNLDNYLTLFDNFKTAHKDATNEVSEIRGSIETIKAWISSNPIKSTTKKKLLDIPSTPEDIIAERALIQSKLDNILTINNKINLNNQYISKISEISTEDITKEIDKPEGDMTAINSEFVTIKTIIAQANNVLTKMAALGDICPTCLQDIDSDIVDQLVSKQRVIVDSNKDKQVELQDAGIELKSKLAEYAGQHKKIEEFEKLSSLIDSDLPKVTEDKLELEAEISELTQEINSKQKEITRVTNSNTDITKYNTELNYLIGQVKEFKLKLLKEETSLRKTNEVYANLEVLKKAFSTNGLVAYKIENLVKDLEDLVNQYLAELSDGRFGLEFVVSNDKLNVVISDEGKTIDILALSSGELARVNTSTLLAIRKLMSTLSKSKINVLFLDEVIGVLDEEGRERLIEVLLKEHELNTFLVSHGWSHPLLNKINVLKEEKISRLEWQ
jgi:DNA repair exonuclease SbcCD ATPase subunit